MKYDVYFHHDIDGLASAAVMLNFLKSRGDDIEHYVPVNYFIQPQWVKRNFFLKHRLFKGHRNPAIVVDFAYHPKAAFWFDHHSTSFRNKKWQKAFKPDKYHCLNAEYPSCCHLVLDTLEREFGFKPTRHLMELARWADIIDGGRYKSPKQTLEIKEPALQINKFIDRNSENQKVTAWLIKLLAARPLKEIAGILRIKKVVRVVRRDINHSLKFYKENIEVLGRITFIDLMGVGSRIMALSFAPYYFYPKTLYSLRITKDGKLFHLNVGANPWRRKYNRFDVGQLLRRYGGGGHKYVGGVEFNSKADAAKAAREIIQLLK